jgi:hypothetical protein
MIINKTRLKAANYGVVGLSVMFVVYCWAMHLKAKQALVNPLIPERLADVYLKPALLFTAVFSVVVALQLVSLYNKKRQVFSAILGLIIIVLAWMLYPYSTGWFLG